MRQEYLIKDIQNKIQYTLSLKILMSNQKMIRLVYQLRMILQDYLLFIYLMMIIIFKKNSIIYLIVLITIKFLIFIKTKVSQYIKKVHPGQITFFENKQLNNGDNFLATSNGDLQYIYIWDVYNLRSVQNFTSNSDNRPDYYIELPKGSQLQNMTWNLQKDELIFTAFNDKLNRQYICKQDFSESHLSSIDIGKVSTQSPGQGLILEQQEIITVPYKINYFSIYEQNSNHVIGTGLGRQFIFDIQTPNSIKYFGQFDQSNQNNDLLVEFNQKDKIVILNKQGSNIKVYDTRNEFQEIMDITFENDVQKIEFDPFNSNQFIILFETYFSRVNIDTNDFQSYWFADQKIFDFCYNKQEPNEFLTGGQVKENDKTQKGFLSLNKMNN